MSSQQVKVKVLEVTYNRMNNLFTMRVENLESHTETKMAILGDDFGVNQKVPDKIINKFCEDMRGKIKNIDVIVEQKNEDLIYSSGDNKDFNPASLQREHDKIDKYPLYEIEKMLSEEDD